jgi:hypothetical protein
MPVWPLAVSAGASRLRGAVRSVSGTLAFMTLKHHLWLLPLLLLSSAPAAAEDENITPRLEGALVEFHSGSVYQFRPKGRFVMKVMGRDFKGKWRFKSGKSLFCVTITFSTGVDTSCQKIVKRDERYIEITESGEVSGSPIKGVKFDHFKK